MSVVSRYGMGLYQSGENEFIIDDGRYHAEKRKVIICRGGHGSDAQGVSALGGGFYFEPFRALVDAGFVVYSVSAGGGTSWWDAASVTALSAAYTHITGLYGVTKVALFGASMGAGVLLQWLKGNPIKVTGLAMLSGPTDLDFFHGDTYTPTYAHPLTPTGNYQSEMNTTYSTNNAGWDAATAGHKIHDEPASWRGLCPVRNWIGTVDATVPFGQAAAFVAAVNDPQVTLRALPGADHIPPVPSAGGPPQQEYVDFFNSLSWS